MAANPEAKMESQVRLIKKYPNRRLYDTKTSSYITLADVKQMVLKQEDFQVVDAKSGLRACQGRRSRTLIVAEMVRWGLSLRDCPLPF